MSRLDRLTAQFAALYSASMVAGDANQHGQQLIRKTNLRSTSHRFATIWVLQCRACGTRYGSNSCDAHIRRCPNCHPQAKPGEPIEQF